MLLSCVPEPASGHLSSLKPTTVPSAATSLEPAGPLYSGALLGFSESLAKDLASPAALDGKDCLLLVTPQCQGWDGGLLGLSRCSKTTILLLPIKPLLCGGGWGHCCLLTPYPPIACHSQGPDFSLLLANTWHLAPIFLCSPNPAINQVTLASTGVVHLPALLSPDPCTSVTLASAPAQLVTSTPTP